MEPSPGGSEYSVPVLRHYYEVMNDQARTLGELKVIIEEIGAEHALVGGLVAGHYGRPRATIDVDFLVPGNKLERLARALEKRGYVVRRALPDMIRVLPPGANLGEDEAIADLVSKDANAVLKAAFAMTEPADILGHRVKIVQRGAFVALKFHAAVSYRRRLGDRYQDVVDIERVIKKHFDEKDMQVARTIAEKMFPGAPGELEKMVEDLRAGRPVTL